MKTVPGLALLGGIAAAVVQPLTPTGWWLNSGRGVAITALTLAVLAALVAAALKGPFRSRQTAAMAALWAGANIGMAAMLFRAGPGTIFPIVLAMGAGISALAVGVGSLAGVVLASVSRRGAG
jgi:hypothetical protein